jgi:ubiquinone biosynthesis monooxygenase Coq7
MPSSPRQFSPLDTALLRLDKLLKSAVGPHSAGRRYPAAEIPETVTDPAQRKTIAGLMRVNHAGEICAQALYHGQAATARLSGVRATLAEAAEEEVDHLAWCAQRLEELGDRPSLLDPIWYLGSFAIGALAGLSGDRRSLGFVAETERQVVEHLQSHVTQLQQNDRRTRAILEQMITDEARHGGAALQQGGELPPAPIKFAMRLTAKLMTITSQRI